MDGWMDGWMCKIVFSKLTLILGAHYRVSAGLKFASDILSEQPQYYSDIWKFFRTFF